jgi:uncharacterized radical SAM superfamily Fe-S cluster-containing enzyme
MARLEERPYTYFTTVRGMCRSCRRVTPARVFFRDGGVWQQSLCPDCASEPALVASDQEWYLRNVLTARPDRSPLETAHPPERGCPHDCGPCSWHASPCQLPVVSVTNECDLECPICFTYNRPERPWHMPVAEMRELVDRLVASSGPLDLINVTGGEPTLHPRILEVLDCCRRPEIGRVTVNTNGLRLSEDRELCAALAELGAYVILSFNTFDTEVSHAMHGRDLVEAKLRALDNLSRAGARVTLLCVMARGLNEDVPGRLLGTLRQSDSVLSLTVQTMTYTGRGGGRFPRQKHLPVDEAVALICAGSGGELGVEDFVARPSAHPLCYSIGYALRSGGRLVPFTRFAPAERVSALMADSYLIRPGETGDFFRAAVDAAHSRGETGHMKVLREQVERLYPPGKTLTDFERQRAAESAVRTVYVHAHMDEDTFDCSRACQCPDLVAGSDGSLTPACTYNLFYRNKDERFYGRE